MARFIKLSFLSLFICAALIAGTAFLDAYFALFIVSPSIIDVEVNSLELSSVPIDITIDPASLFYDDFTVEAYGMDKFSHCNQYDEDFNCLDWASSLCPFINFESTEGESTDFGSVGELHLPSDGIDKWKINILAPCFEGECPAGYSGTKLSQAQKDKIFKCDVYVNSTDEPVLVKSISPKTAYAQTFPIPQNRIEISAVIKSAEVGLSNVAFLPGLQGSRLYRLGEDQLWEPTRNQDVEELYLSDDGDSMNSSIYTRDVIDESPQVINGYNIYKGFIQFMDEEMVGAGIINEWKALPYDWRLALEDMLASGKKIGEKNGEDNISYLDATSTPYIFQELERLAETSDTGKVTIITHSNGGLVAKYLLRQLEDVNHPYHALLEKIDKLIMVAAPQVGTPAAIEGLLHGDEPQLGAAVGVTDWGFLVDEMRARELSENMSSAYNLLPSPKYFDSVQSPVVEFKSSTDRAYDFSNLYGPTIDTFSELENFLLGDPQAASGRSEPAPNDEESPNVLDEALLSQSSGVHNLLDSWIPPPGMEVIQIAGWGIKTVQGIEYSCGFLTCASLSTLNRNILKTHEGDGTVVLPSAVAMSTSSNVEKYYVNIQKYNREGLLNQRKNRDHSSILGVESLLTFLKNIIQNDRTLTGNITTTIPSIGDLTSLDYAIHSPVDIHIYDSNGNHTGLIPNPLPNSDLRAYEAQIHNSYYWEYGEVKYAGSDTFSTTTVELIGKDLGTFTFEINETHGDETAASKIYRDIPVTASSTLVMDIKTIQESTPLQMDVDGDGAIDTPISPGEGVTPQELFAILKGIVKTLDLPSKQEEKLLKKIDKLEKAFEKEYKNEFKKKQKTDKAFDGLTDKIKKLEKKKVLTREDAKELVEIIEKIRSRVLK